MVGLIYPSVRQELCHCSGRYCIFKIMQLRSAEAPRGVTSRYHMPITTFFFFFLYWKWKLSHRINATKDTRSLQNSEESDIPKLHYFTLLAIKIKQSSLESSVWNDRLNSWAYYLAFKGWDFLTRASVAGVGQSVCQHKGRYETSGFRLQF